MVVGEEIRVNAAIAEKAVKAFLGGKDAERAAQAIITISRVSVNQVLRLKAIDQDLFNDTVDQLANGYNGRTSSLKNQ